MKINKHINYNLEFENGTLCDLYLASSLYKYIIGKNPKLKDSIGYSAEDNPTGIPDFLYGCSGNATKIIKEIEEHIKEFIKYFVLVEDILEKQCDEGLINDNVDFYEQFQQLSNMIKQKKELDSKLIKNGNKTKKIKI